MIERQVTYRGQPTEVKGVVKISLVVLSLRDSCEIVRSFSHFLIHNKGHRRYIPWYYLIRDMETKYLVLKDD